jgi:glycerol kinase
VCGDQQASLAAAGTHQGTTKVTYGTGTFILQSLGVHFKLYPDFYTTLIPHPQQPWYALEAKIEQSGKRIQDAINESKPLTPILNHIVCTVNAYIKKLPHKPAKLIVDGGITQSAELLKLQRIASGISVQPQKIFDGTALGIATLMQEASVSP